MPRYIDADALKNELIECTPYAVDPVYRNTNSNIDMFTVMEMLDGQPAADVVPVVRGEWTNGYFQDLVCTACTHPSPCDEKTIYCPNCGAKMDGDKHDRI